MLMKVMSLALSLVSVQSFNSFLQHESRSNQVPHAEETQQLKQEKKDGARSPGVINIPLKISVQPIALPSGDNAWAVQIVSRGGLTGSGKGDLTITSEGTLFWNGAEGGCSRRLNDESVQALTEIVVGAKASSNSDGSQLNELCLHCYVTAMIVQRRIGGVESMITASWDDTSQAKIPADAMAIYDALMRYKGCEL